MAKGIVQVFMIMFSVLLLVYCVVGALPMIVYWNYYKNLRDRYKDLETN